jgi:predicted TIM-barrel fold metal-dependent hydrolase
MDKGRWPGQESIKPYEAFKAQLEERVYVDTSGFWGYTTPMQAAHAELPSSQLLFGTDAPYEPRTEDELSRHATVVMNVASERDAAAILGGNALELMINVEE